MPQRPAPVCRHSLRPEWRPPGRLGGLSRRGAALALALGAGLAGPPAHAATLTWNGGLGAPFWSSRLLVASNWDGGAVPQDGDALVFAGRTGLLNINDYAALSLSGLSFAADAGAFTLNGPVPGVLTQLTLTGNLVNASSQRQTLNLGIVAQGDTRWDGGTQGLLVQGGLLLRSSSTLSLENRVTLRQSSALAIGTSGSSRLSVLSGSQLSTRDVSVGEGSGSSGQVSVFGPGSLWEAQGRLQVGDGGQGTVYIEGGAAVTSQTGGLGRTSQSRGSVIVTGDSSQWLLSGDLKVGGDGSGLLSIHSGARVSNQGASIGAGGGRNRASATVDGAGSRWINRDALVIGTGVGGGYLLVSDGGFISSASGVVGGPVAADAQGSATLTGAGSLWSMAGDLAVGKAYAGTVVVQLGAQVRNANAVLGLGTVLVQDAGSAWVSSGSVEIGRTDIAALTLRSGGAAVIGGPLVIAPSGSVLMEGGTLEISSATVQDGGRFDWASGVLRFSQPGATLGAGQFQLDSSTTLRSTQTLEFNRGFAVGSGHQLQLAGGTLGGAGSLLNDGLLTGFGALAGRGGFVNSGLLVQAGGTLVLANAGTNLNTGNWDLGVGQPLQLAGATLANHGSLNLNGGSVSGSGRLDNAAGGVVSGRGSVSSLFSNAGTLALESGTTRIEPAFANTGQIQLASPAANLTGGQLSNTGRIEGHGRIGNAIDNAGMLHAMGGTLSVAADLSNTASGVIAVDAGATLLVLRGLARNAGALQLAGGSFDNNAAALVNEPGGIVSGFGTLRSGELLNQGKLLLAGGPTDVHADLRATAGSQIILSGRSQAVFLGAVEIEGGAELRVSGGSAATFFGVVSLRGGALLSGEGAKFFEGGLGVGNSPGLAQDAGDVSFGARNLYTVEVAGIGPGDALGQGIGFDRYQVAGRLSFGGTLKVVTLSGFVPQAGQRLDLFDWGSSQGAFASLDFSLAPLPAGLSWDSSNLYRDGSLQVASVPEPGRVGLLLAGLGIVGWKLRRASEAPRSGGSVPTPRGACSAP